MFDNSNDLGLAISVDEIIQDEIIQDEVLIGFRRAFTLKLLWPLMDWDCELPVDAQQSQQIDALCLAALKDVFGEAQEREGPTPFQKAAYAGMTLRVCLSVHLQQPFMQSQSTLVQCKAHCVHNDMSLQAVKGQLSDLRCASLPMWHCGGPLHRICLP